jgi:hypothetical protein
MADNFVMIDVTFDTGIILALAQWVALFTQHTLPLFFSAIICE